MATKVNPVTGALDYYEQALPSFRNKVINGAMQISQRGNVTGITTTTYGGPDRFQNILGSAGTWSLSKSTDVPSGSGFSNTNITHPNIPKYNSSSFILSSIIVLYILLVLLLIEML